MIGGHGTLLFDRLPTVLKLFLTNNSELSSSIFATVSENGWNLCLQYGWKNSWKYFQLE